MALGYTLRLFRTGDASAFRQVLEKAAADFGSPVTWNCPGERDQDFRTGTTGATQSTYLPYQGADFPFFEHVGRVSGLAWIELRIQEDTIWDYALYQGVECVDLFSVCPQYWEDGEVDEIELSRWRGKPHLLARMWGLPVEHISSYLVNWGYECKPDDDVIRFKLQGKAYPNDTFGYGQYEQFFDVLRALGGVEPTEMHTLVLPPVRTEKSSAKVFR